MDTPWSLAVCQNRIRTWKHKCSSGFRLITHTMLTAYTQAIKIWEMIQSKGDIEPRTGKVGMIWHWFLK